METIISKYQNGIIYKITDIAYTKCYYGSTINKMSKRFSGHIQHYKKWKQGGKNCTSFSLFEEFGIDNCKIELVELFPCNSKIELYKKEGEYIKNNDCVNKCVPRRTYKEYLVDNKEHEIERHRQYHEANKQKVNEKHRQYYEANKQKVNEKQRQYYEANKEAIQLKRRLKKNILSE
jgi:hypothetical protein